MCSNQSKEEEQNSASFQKCVNRGGQTSIENTSTSQSNEKMRSSHSPNIRSRYDYYYSSMSPASSAINFYDNQNQSLFGDPVPPSTDFLETLDNHLYGSFRKNSLLGQPAPSDTFIEDFIAAQNRLRIQSGRAATGGDRSFRPDYQNDHNRQSSSSYSDDLLRANDETLR